MSEVNKYNRGKIYKITVEGCNLVYYGSTIKPYLSNHLGAHKQNWKKWKEGKRSMTTSCKLFEIGNPIITLVEDFACERKEQLLARERWYIENNICVNKNVPTRTIKEWKNDNIESIQNREKEWRNNHKEYLKEYNKHYRSSIENLQEVEKARREKRKEYLQEYMKNYYIQKKSQSSNCK